MATASFPDTQSESLGHFWLPGSPDLGQTGVVEVADHRITLKVSPELTPTWEYQEHPNGYIEGVPAKRVVNFVVLGTIPTQPAKVSLWGTRSVARKEIGLFSFDSPTRTSQTLESSWCLAGGHVENPDTRFLGVRVDVTNLAEWAGIQSLTSTRFPFKKEATWHFALPEGYDEELTEGRGYLTLMPSGLIEPLTIRGATIQTETTLEVELIEDRGWALADAISSLADPVTSLFTILTGVRCGLRKLSVWDGTNWLSVHGRHLEPDAPAHTGELLLRLRDTGPKMLIRWMDTHKQTSPVPQILAASISNEFHTVESEALSLVTAVEALHRTLHPDSRRFDDDQITKAIVALERLGEDSIDSPVNESLRNALKQYWGESSYPQRILELAEPVAEAIPGCLGKLNKWKSAVASQRVGLAHGMSQESDSILKTYSLNRSIWWMLTLRLLLESDIPADVLTAALTSSERFENDRSLWRKHWPKIWGSD